MIGEKSTLRHLFLKNVLYSGRVIKIACRILPPIIFESRPASLSHAMGKNPEIQRKLRQHITLHSSMNMHASKPKQNYFLDRQIGTSSRSDLLLQRPGLANGNLPYSRATTRTTIAGPF